MPYSRPLAFATMLLLACGVAEDAPANDMFLESSDAVADTLITHDQNPPSWKTLPKHPSVVVFTNGDTLESGLQELQQIGMFTSPTGREWFILSARSCMDCSQPKALHFISAGHHGSPAMVMKDWHLPGRLLDKDKVAYYEGKVFVGEVLRDTMGAIWYDRSLMPDGTWRTNTVLLKLDREMPDTLIFFGQNRKSITQELAFRGMCTELKGEEQNFASWKKPR